MPYKDKDKARAADRRRYERNKEKRLAAQRARYHANLEASRARQRLKYKASDLVKRKKRVMSKSAYERLRVLRRYGLTAAQYETLVAKNHGRCWCCNAVASRLVIDHDHTTGVVRGLLCNKCNLLIGGVGDTLESVETFARDAMAYLQGALDAPPLGQYG